jgi:hypothetical protein
MNARVFLQLISLLISIASSPAAWGAPKSKWRQDQEQKQRDFMGRRYPPNPGAEKPAAPKYAPGTSISPIPPEKGWKRIGSFSGAATKTTEIFYLDKGEYRIRWKFKGDFFSAFLNRYTKDEDEIVQLFANVTASGEDTTFFRGPGNFFLKISIDGEYIIAIDKRDIPDYSDIFKPE